MLDETRKMALEALQNELDKIPHGTPIIIDDLCDHCEDIVMNDRGEYEIEGRERFNDPLDLPSLESYLFGRAREVGLIPVREKEGFSIRERIPRDKPLRSAEIAFMSFGVYTFMDCSSDVFIHIENGVLSLSRPTEGTVAQPVRNAARSLDALLDRCGVSGWNDDYHPEYFVADGTDWSLLVITKDGRALHCRGGNAWPDTLQAFIDGAEDIATGRQGYQA